MAAAVLRHHRLALNNPAGYYAVMPTVSASRALVVSKLILTVDVAATRLFVVVSPGIANAGAQASPQPETAGRILATELGVGEVYTETGIIVLAGNQITIFSSAGVNSVVSVNVFGREIDN